MQAYGRGAIVGEDGELEHGAVWHEAGGWAMRAVLGQPRLSCRRPRTVGTLERAPVIPLGHRTTAACAAISSWRK